MMTKVVPYYSKRKRHSKTESTLLLTFVILTIMIPESRSSNSAGLSLNISSVGQRLVTTNDTYTNTRKSNEIPPGSQEEYTGLPPERNYHGEQCRTNKDCYQIFGKSLECRDETCQCMIWNGVELLWNGKNNICLGANHYHQCSAKSMCHSGKCQDRHCVSAGTRHGQRQRYIVTLSSFLQEVVIHISVIIIARLVV